MVTPPQMALLFCPNNLDLIKNLSVTRHVFSAAIAQNRLPRYAWGTQSESLESNQFDFLLLEKTAV